MRRMVSNQDVKAIFREADWSTEEVQERVDTAFDILFEEILKLEIEDEITISGNFLKGA